MNIETDNSIYWQPKVIKVIGFKETVYLQAPIVINGLATWLLQGNMEGLRYFY